MKDETSGSGPKAVVGPPTQPVVQAMMELTETVEALKAALEELSQRLEAILRPRGQSKPRPKDENGSEGEGVAMAAAINVQADRLREIRNTVVDLLDRVGI